MSKAPLFVVSDEAVLNSYGFCVLTSGINYEERFKDNPICLNNHNNDTRHVLGSWIDIEVKDGKLYMRPVFDTKDPDGVEVVRKVLSGTIKASSIGIMFDPVDMVLMNGRLTLTKCILFEVSIVAVPSNANAIALFNMAGQQLSEQEIKSLCLSIQPEKHFNNNTMKLLTAHLQLPENATEEAILSAVKAVELKLTESQNTNATLKAKIQTLEDEAKEKNTAELTAELEAAVKDGRIDEAGKAPILELTHESAMKLLKSLPKRKSVAKEIEANEKTPEEMFGKLSWSELDKTNKLGKLKAEFPEYYAERFEQHFGKKPSN